MIKIITNPKVLKPYFNRIHYLSHPHWSYVQEISDKLIQYHYEIDDISFSFQIG